MPADQQPSRHLIVEARYQPTLKFYAAMDQIGLAEMDSFPEWERSPLTLEIRNRDHHRRFFMSHQRSFYEALGWANDSGEFNRAVGLLGRLHHELGFTQFRRVGMRQIAGYPVEEAFERLVRRFTDRWHPGGIPVENIIRGYPIDVGYAFNVQTHDAWRYHLRAGPMKREQWFELLPAEPGLFPTLTAVEEYKETIHERMIFVDVDGYQEDLPFADLERFANAVRQTSSTIIQELVAFVRG
jgi:hypothetical protein